MQVVQQSMHKFIGNASMALRLRSKKNLDDVQAPKSHKSEKNAKFLKRQKTSSLNKIKSMRIAMQNAKIAGQKKARIHSAGGLQE